MLSSGKLHRSDLSSMKNKSLRYMLKIRGPRIEPWRTLKRISTHELKVWLIFVLCHLLERDEKISFREQYEKPYAWSLATNNSWFKESNAFERSMRIAPR